MVGLGSMLTNLTNHDYNRFVAYFTSIALLHLCDLKMIGSFKCRVRIILLYYYIIHKRMRSFATDINRYEAPQYNRGTAC